MTSISQTQLVYRQLGLRVEQLRSTLGWTQMELSKKVGISRASIANLETGRQRVQLHQLERLAEAFGTSPKHLMRGIWS